MDLSQAGSYCKNKVAKSGSSFYYSFLFLPPEQRKAITALYAFCREVDDIVDECSDQDIARQKLLWWTHEITRLFQGSPQHPVSIALQPWILSFGWQQPWFEEIIAGMIMDLDFQGYATFDDLSIYCYRVAGVVGMLATKIFGKENLACLSFARDLGTALQLVNIIRDIGEDVRRGRIYIPSDELKRFEIEPSDLLSLKDSPSLRKLLAFQATRARSYYQKALAQLPKEHHYEQQSALIMAAVYFKLLEVMEKDSFNVLSQRYSLTPLHKFWVAWRTHRKLKAHR